MCISSLSHGLQDSSRAVEHPRRGRVSPGRLLLDGKCARGAGESRLTDFYDNHRRGVSVNDKYREDLMAALEVVPSGSSIAVGGFGSSGRPDALLNALCDLDKRDLHVIVNNVGDDFTGIGRLVVEGRVRRFTGSFPILQSFYDAYFAG